MRLSVVIPVLNEAPTLPELHCRLSEALYDCRNHQGLAGYELLFVDDGSTDGSLAVLAHIAEADLGVSVVRLPRGPDGLPRSQGKSAALAAGFARARGDVIATLDADLQDQPEELPALLARLRDGPEAGADMVIGRRLDRRDPWTRRLASRVFNAVVSRATGLRFRDINSGLKVFRVETVRGLPLREGLHRYLPVLVAARGFRVEEVDVAHGPRRHGRSRYGWGRYLAAARDLAIVLRLMRAREASPAPVPVSRD